MSLEISDRKQKRMRQLEQSTARSESAGRLESCDGDLRRVHNEWSLCAIPPKLRSVRLSLDPEGPDAESNSSTLACTRSLQRYANWSSAIYKSQVILSACPTQSPPELDL